MRTLIAGCGYLGRCVGQRLVARGETVFGLVRTAQSAAVLSAAGITGIQADVTNPATLIDLPDVDRILYCVGFDRAAGPSLCAVYVDGLSHFLTHLGGFAGRFVYVSSTGVYGQDDGSWVDESSPTEPVSASGRVCLEAEGLLPGHAVVLRLAGLYGPGRVLRCAGLARGEPISGDPAHWLNLIQRDDAARFCVAALDHPSPESLYLVADDRPVTRREFYEHAAAILDAPPVRFPTEVDSLAPRHRRDRSNKRVRNQRIRTVFALDLLYPDITTGLRAALLAPSGFPTR